MTITEHPVVSQKVYTGQIMQTDIGEAMDILWLDEGSPVWDDPVPLARAIQDDMEDCGHYLTVQYVIADRPVTTEMVTDELMTLQAGLGHAEYVDQYSDITGYLWTDEELKVGGHDLLAELRAFVGKYLWLSIMYTTASTED